MVKYRVIQEERPIILEMIVWVIVIKKIVRMNKCLILNGYRATVVRIFRPNSFRFLFVRLDEQLSTGFSFKVYTQFVNIQDLILD